MDALDKALTKKIEFNGKRYTFKKPSAKESIRIDVLAAAYRQSLPIASLSYALGLSNAVATLNVLCIDPKTVEVDSDGYDFGDLDPDDLNEIYTMVSEWLSSFRKRVEQEKTDLGQGNS
jgi:hypothetical protein